MVHFRLPRGIEPTMKSSKRLNGCSRVAACLACLVIGSRTMAASTAGGAGGGGSAPKPPARTAKQIQDDLLALHQQFESSGNFPVDVVFDPVFQQQMSSTMQPLIRRRQVLTTELSALSPQWAAKTRFPILRDDAELAYFNDNGAIAAVEARTKSSDPSVVIDGQLAQALRAWWLANGKPQEQTAILDAMQKLATAQPRNDDVAGVLIRMIETSPATVALGQRANNLVCKTMKSPVASEYAAKSNKLFTPLVVSGTNIKGSTTSTDKWKGKVVLVDFWATWCPPCRESLPGLVKLYQENHDKGLEVLGVSSDSEAPALASFLKDHPEIVWPQLFTANGSGAWHPLTKRFGIEGIPKVYLIDRAGLLRSLDSYGQREEALVQQLLAEPAPAAAGH
jgi:thiol-disulfide isomerase/thioredoxin